MAILTTQTITRAGIVPTYAAAAAGGDACECGDNITLEVINGDAADHTVTLAIPSAASTFSNVAYTSTTVTVTAGTRKRIGPLSPALYKDPTTGLCQITYSAVTSVTVGVFKVQP